MKRETLKAIKDSIAHWERLASGKHGQDEQPFADDCALCQRFNGPSSCMRDDGEVCPIAKKTGLVGCRDTPHDDLLLGNKWYNRVYGDAALCEWKSGARAMIRYLKALLPNDKQKKGVK